MRTLCLFLALCLPVPAQQATTYTTDIHGRRTVDGQLRTAQSGNAVTRTELTQSINGRTVPLEQVEERVIREDANGRVVERIVKRFDPSGNPAQSEKQEIEERFNTDGSVSSASAVYRSDLNGRFQLAERVTEESSKSGDTVNANVRVERPSVNGNLEVVEKQVRVASGGKTAAKSDVTTFRKDQAGRFVEALRVVTDAADQNGQRVENTAQYEQGDSGRLRLAAQTVSRVRKNPDGSESREVDIFRAVPGRADPSSSPQLQERQIIEQRKIGDQLVETTSVRRPTINDPNRLGAPAKIGERVCTGAACK